MRFLKLWFIVAVLSLATLVGVGIGLAAFLALLWLLWSSLQLLAAWFGGYVVYGVLTFLVVTLLLTIIFHMEEHNEREGQAYVDEEC